MWTLSQDITRLLLAFKIKIHIHKFTYLLTYLLTYEYRETFRHGIIAMHSPDSLLLWTANVDL